VFWSTYIEILEEITDEKRRFLQNVHKLQPHYMASLLERQYYSDFRNL